MSTMLDVARVAGVSVATVSRVLNRTSYVSPELVERVEEAIEQLNYQPSALARNLRQRVTQTVGLLIPQLHQPFFSKLAYSIEQTLFAHGYHTLICSAEEDANKEDAYINMFTSRRVDGVILVPTGHSINSVERLLDRAVPVVLVDRDLPGLEINRVLCDNEKGGYDAMQYLLELGHRHIGIIGAPSYSDPLRKRISGAQRALAHYGINLPPELLYIDDMPQFDMGFNTLLRLVEMQPKPSAIFALTDMVALGVVHAAETLGLKLPDELSVMGFDDTDPATYVIPQLTTIAQPVMEMGARAAEILLRSLGPDEPAATESVVLAPELVVRRSTAPHRTASESGE